MRHQLSFVTLLWADISWALAPVDVKHAHELGRQQYEIEFAREKELQVCRALATSPSRMTHRSIEHACAKRYLTAETPLPIRVADKRAARGQRDFGSLVCPAEGWHACNSATGASSRAQRGATSGAGAAAKNTKHSTM